MTDRTAGDGGAAISVERMTKTFGPVVAVDNVSIDIQAGEFLALLGPSGSGKTTILMGIAGFEYPTSGRVLIDGTDVTYQPVNKRNLGMVFQKYTLFPHLSVRDNVAFPLKMRGIDRRERHARAETVLETVRLGGYGDRMPSQLSGGQQQRVALARAIVYQPRVLLMDEPLSALDRNLREEMQLEIKRLQSKLGITVVFVTHDQDEALTMADRVAILKDGRLQQLDTPRALYETPANRFVAGFVGETNLIPAGVKEHRADGLLLTMAGNHDVATPAGVAVGHAAPGRTGTLAIRPERIALGAPDDGQALPAILSDVIYAGSSVLLIGQIGDGVEIRARLPGTTSLNGARPGARIGFVLPPDAMRFYAEDAPR